jgi:hypothetical protein
MTGTRVAAVSALALANLAFGWSLGYRSIRDYFLFWLTSGLVLAAAARLARLSGAGPDPADRVIRCGVLAFGLVALGGLILGFAGLVGTGAFVAFAVLCCAAAYAVRPTPPARPAAPWDAGWLAWAALVPLLTFGVVVGMRQSPMTLYDSLSYHLYFPARWLLAHRVSIVPTPFSDPAQAYQPANGELLFLWLMAPFHGDLVARIGQLPFLLVGAVAIHAIAVRVGAPRTHSIVAVLLYLVARPIVEQAVGADVDLICSAMLLASLYFGLVAVDTDDIRDWMLWGISLGLFWGSKYLALVYSPVVIVFPFVGRLRPRALWAIPGVVLLALPWYLRNWVVAGSPIYPASLQLGELVIARGAFTRDAMINTVFHVTDPKLLPAIVAHAFGVPLFLVWLPLAIAGVVFVVRHPPRWPGIYIVVVPLLMVALFWFALPVNIDSRFLLGAVAVAFVPTAFAFGLGRTSAAWLQAACIVALAWVLAGVHRDVPISLPWYMSEWLRLDGLVPRSSLALFAALAAAGALAWQLTRRAPHYRAPLLAVLVGGSAVGLARASDGSDRLALSSIFVRPTLVAGWDFVRANVHDATIAYTGNNLPYPLFGDRLTNRVYYVSIDRHVDWSLHDYARVRRRSTTAPSHPLARPSGELMPVHEHAGAYEDASRPRYERIEGLRDAWISNLRTIGVNCLFVTSLSAYEIDNQWHNEGGFPIEDQWAREDPAAFQLVYDNETVRVYRVAF